MLMTEDALPNTPTTALVRFGAVTAIAMAINANMIAYSTIVTPFVFVFFCTMLLLKSLDSEVTLLRFVYSDNVHQCCLIIRTP